MNETGQISDFTSERAGSCTFSGVKEHQLTVFSAIAFPLASLVKVEIGNRMWMGEVCALTPAAGGYEIEIQIESTLTNVAAVQELAARFRHERAIKPKPGVAPVSTRRDIT